MPPLVGGFADGKVTWQRLDDIDFDMLGYLLSCHLVIEHYLDHFLQAEAQASLDWDGARLTFAQKAALATSLPFVAGYNFMPALKHLNSLRNRFAHNIDVKLVEKDFEPLRSFLLSCTKDPGGVPTQPRKILSMFMGVACAYMASAIAHTAQFRHGPNS